MVFLALVFGLIYPRKRPLARHWWVWAALIAGLAASEFMFLLDNALVVTRAPRADGTFAFVANGPLRLVVVVQQIAYAGLSLLFARDHAREPPGPLRHGLLLVSIGWGLFGIYLLPNNVAGLLRNGFQDGWDVVYLIVDAFTFAFAFAALWVIRAAARRDANGPVRMRRVLAAYSLAVATGIGAGVWSRDFVGNLALDELFNGLWKLAIPLLVSYALARGQLYDIDLKVKWTLRQSTVAGVFIAVFFIVSEFAKEIFSSSVGPILGILATGLLVFAIAPIQRMADGVAGAAMPGVKNTAEWRAGRKRELFKGSLRLALADRVITRAEERHLADLAAHLALDPRSALAMREEVEQELGLAAPPTTASPPTRAATAAQGRPGA